MRYYRIGMQEVRKRNDAIVYIMNNKNFNDIILRSARKVNSWCNDIYFEFDIPKESVRKAGDRGIIPGPDSIDSRLRKKRGEPQIDFPKPTNIRKVKKK